MVLLALVCVLKQVTLLVMMRVTLPVQVVPAAADLECWICLTTVLRAVVLIAVSSPGREVPAWPEAILEGFLLLEAPLILAILVVMPGREVPVWPRADLIVATALCAAAMLIPPEPVYLTKVASWIVSTVSIGAVFFVFVALLVQVAQILLTVTVAAAMTMLAMLVTRTLTVPLLH